MNRRTYTQRTNHASRHQRQNNPWQDFANQESLLRRHSSSRKLTLPTRRQTLTGLVAGAIIATTLSACAVYHRLSPTIESLLKTPQPQQELVIQETANQEPVYQSSTPFMDALEKVEVDSLKLDLPTENLGHLIRDAWKPLFLTLEEVNNTSAYPREFPLICAVVIKETKLIERTENGRYGFVGERHFESSSGIPGVFPISDARRHEYNSRHLDQMRSRREMDSYRKNMTAGIEELALDLQRQDGNIFNGLIAWASGPGTLADFQDTDSTQTLLQKNLLYNASPGRLAQQARKFPYDVAVLAYRIQELGFSLGLTEQEMGIVDARREYQDFMTLGEKYYRKGKEESRKKWDGDSKTTYDDRLARVYDDLPIRLNKFSGDIIEGAIALHEQNMLMATQNTR